MKSQTCLVAEHVRLQQWAEQSRPELMGTENVYDHMT